MAILKDRGAGLRPKTPATNGTVMVAPIMLIPYTTITKTLWAIIVMTMVAHPTPNVQYCTQRSSGNWVVRSGLITSWAKESPAACKKESAVDMITARIPAAHNPLRPSGNNSCTTCEIILLGARLGYNTRADKPMSMMRKMKHTKKAPTTNNI